MPWLGRVGGRGVRLRRRRRPRGQKEGCGGNGGPEIAVAAGEGDEVHDPAGALPQLVQVLLQVAGDLQLLFGGAQLL